MYSSSYLQYSSTILLFLFHCHLYNCNNVKFAILSADFFLQYFINTHPESFCEIKKNVINHSQYYAYRAWVEKDSSWLYSTSRIMQTQRSVKTEDRSPLKIFFLHWRAFSFRGKKYELKLKTRFSKGHFNCEGWRHLRILSGRFNLRGSFPSNNHLKCSSEDVQIKLTKTNAFQNFHLCLCG